MESLTKFNKTFEELLNTIKSDWNKYILCENIDSGDTEINNFLKNSKNKEHEISTKNEIIFSKNEILIKNIDFYNLWSDPLLNDENRNIIWNYIHTLYIYSYEYSKNKSINEILEELKNVEIESNKLDVATKSLLNIIETLKNKNIDKEDIDDILDDTNNEKSTNNFEIPEIFNGAIGKLANEIADDIDTDNLNIEDPSKLLEGLFSGNFDLENDTTGISSLVENITGKIQQKITNGELNEQELFSEANNVMSQLNNNNMFSNLVNNVEENMPKKVVEALPDVKQKEKEKLQKRRDYLKKKLEQKKMEKNKE